MNSYKPIFAIETYMIPREDHFYQSLHHIMYHNYTLRKDEASINEHFLGHESLFLTTHSFWT